MLNDLLAIERGLTAHGIDLVARHPDIKDMARGGALRVRLDAQGSISEVELVTEAGRGAVWTLRNGQHNGFPGLKTIAGLLLLDAETRAQHDRIWGGAKSPIAQRNELLRLLAANPLDGAQATRWPSARHRRRIAERLSLLGRLRDDPKTAAVPAAFERFLLALDASPSFMEQLAAAIATHVRDDGDAWLEPARRALLSPLVALTIDVAEGAFNRDAGDPRQVGPVSLALSGAATDVLPAGKGGGICALTGKPARLHSGNFPEPNLPSLGQVKLFSRNKDIYALYRYGKTANESFSVASDVIDRLSGVIKFLVGPDLHNKTWRRIPGERLISQNGKKVERWDLLIVSLPAAPNLPLAETIADKEDDGNDDVKIDITSKLKKISERVVSQSRGLYEHEHAQDFAVILVLRKIDKGNHKAIYHRRTTSTNLHAAAKNWHAATSNTPDWLGFRMPAKARDGKAATTLRRPPSVAPLSIVSLSRVQFANGGRRRVDVIGTTAATAFGLFLREGDVSRRATALLRLLLQRHGALLTGLAAARSKGIDHLKDFDPKTDLRRDALRSTTWIGALLYFLQRPKDIYMSDAGFRLGQLLAAADVVHIGYCTDIRGGDIPMTLIGNSVFSIAGTDPTRALSILSSRWKPYGAWAIRRPQLNKKVEDIFKRSEPLREQVKKLKGAEALKIENQVKAIEAPGWAMRNGLSHVERIGPLCGQLASDLKDTQPNDQFKAELLLGYMAGLPPLPKKEGDAASSDDGDHLTDQNKEEAE